MNKSRFTATNLVAMAICAWHGPSIANQDQDEVWSGAAELGVIVTSGNTESTSVKGGLEVEQALENWNNEYQFDVLFKEDQVTDDTTGEEETEKTAEKYFLSAKGNRRLEDDKSKLFLFGSHTDDKFAGVSEYTIIAAGYGRRLLETTHTSLDADIGPGYAFGEQSDGEEIEDVILRASANFRWDISENAKFVQKISTEAGADNTRTIAETSLTTQINGSLSMKLGLTITNNSEVPDDTEKTDTESTVTLVYSF
ncbi:DUF481 domain-containing protein [Exilibacterium tricleocarpae]|uniref:DUF481 domain-containing protein n=1 Tax=Exilibacterium tricleocarpae TaxID=2591008 RepID=A0A545TFL2_9GAMM|nr:DUF481 domain-containing protein [Exilibacterium tricleocarpae]TQV76024.1 DUF481 domain-containing protein [Exilibacterium tricleocarpae]